jgi:putative membrane protein
LLFLLVGHLVHGFHVESFWHALWGAFVVSLTGAAANFLFGSSRVKVQVNRGPGGRGPSGSGSAQQKRKPIKDDDVIDI